eukprot:5619638-Pyramimonas_sp.AAC.1
MLDFVFECARGQGETRIRWGRPLRNVPRRLQTLDVSLSDKGGGDIHDLCTTRGSPASHPGLFF